MGSIEEIEYQENAVETAIEINSPSETKNDRSPHNGEEIDEIIVLCVGVPPFILLVIYIVDLQIITNYLYNFKRS